ncbi:Hypothetical predicted protein [Drosophila guanche]|nr:Hypothetical predicted protein [Drosophila guanche]
MLLVGRRGVPHHTNTQSQHMNNLAPTSSDEVEQVSANNNEVVSSEGATLSTITGMPVDSVTLMNNEQLQHDAAAVQAHQKLVAQAAAAAQNSIAAAGQPPSYDEYDAIGVNVATKLRALNPLQRITAVKLIGDVLFNGQLNDLTVSSIVTHST